MAALGSVSRLVDAELNRHDWSGLRRGCGGTAEHVPDMFRAIIEGGVALGDECRFKVREGIWAVLRTGLVGDAESVADILAAVEPG